MKYTESYYKLPRMFFENKRFKNLDTKSKFIYAYLYDKMDNCEKNNWIDENGCYFVVVDLSEIEKLILFGTSEVIKFIMELENNGLVEIVGDINILNCSNMKIYPKDISSLEK